MLKRISVCLLALLTTGCTTVIQPARVVTIYHPPPPIAVYSHTEVRPEVYYFSTRTPVVVYREHHVYRHHHHHWRRW
jgi:hypothetical protein